MDNEGFLANRPAATGQRENGSAFLWPRPVLPPVPAPERSVEAHWPGGILVGCGRDALRIAAAGTQRLWAPSYFCEEVLTAIQRPGLVIARYHDEPTLPYRPFAGPAAGDAVLLCNTFGLRSKPSTLGFLRAGVNVIEDHTHDPWSPWARESEADTCVASLRKSLPLPDGGVVWAPKGRTLEQPGPMTLERWETSCRHAAAMILKRLHFEGDPSIDQHFFRKLSLAADAAAGAGDPVAMTPWSKALFDEFPAGAWRRRRQRNAGALHEALGSPVGLTVLGPLAEGDLCPFMGVLVFDTPERCSEVRKGLIAERIFPGILWPETGSIDTGAEAESIAGRSLCIHVDGRYEPDDMQWIAATVRRLLAAR